MSTYGIHQARRDLREIHEHRDLEVALAHDRLAAYIGRLERLLEAACRVEDEWHRGHIKVSTEGARRALVSLTLSIPLADDQ